MTTFLDFRVSGPLIRYIRLAITFLFIEPQFRYPFLSPLPHDSQAWESLLGSPVAGAHGGLTPQMHDMPVVPKNKLQK
jgi:transposase